MISVEIRDATGATTGSVELDERIFGVQPNVPVMHQVVTAQLAAARRGTHSTKTRAEVRGGGAKPWRQKGTGRARHGSIRNPQWRGGGVALGPKPRSYAQRTPKKMVRLALRSALSDRATDGKVAVVDWGISDPKTKSAKAALAALALEGRILVVLTPDDEATAKSFRNLPEVHLLRADQLNAYDVLCSDWVVFTPASLPTADDTAPAITLGDDGTAVKAPAKKATAKKATAKKAVAKKAVAKKATAKKATAKKVAAEKTAAEGADTEDAPADEAASGEEQRS